MINIKKHVLVVTSFLLSVSFLFPLEVSGAECSCTATFNRVSISTRGGVPGTRVTECTRTETFTQPDDQGRHFRTLYAIIDTWWNNTTASITCRAGEPIDTDTFLGVPDPDTEITSTTCPSLRYSSYTEIALDPTDLQTYELVCTLSGPPSATPTGTPSTSATSGGQGITIENNYEGIPFALPSTGGLRQTTARDIPTLIGQAVRFVTGIFGSIALVMIIYGGIQIMFASGQKDKFKQGTKIIAWASIGLVTMMLSYVLVTFVLGAF